MENLGHKQDYYRRQPVHPGLTFALAVGFPQRAPRIYKEINGLGPTAGPPAKFSRGRGAAL